jgi:hypothetical protein
MATGREMLKRLRTRRDTLRLPPTLGLTGVQESDLHSATDLLITHYGSGAEMLSSMIDSGNPENVHLEYCSLAGIGPETVDEVWTLLDCDALVGRTE